ncbi:MAG: hypothetical protein L6416_07145 [Candidatus Omnitrophica bacterium]|nr:hypothetical protein [Candidatus Omnitrophota bacterium]
MNNKNKRIIDRKKLHPRILGTGLKACNIYTQWHSGGYQLRFPFQCKKCLYKERVDKIGRYWVTVLFLPLLPLQDYCAVGYCPHCQVWSSTALKNIKDLHGNTAEYLIEDKLLKGISYQGIGTRSYYNISGYRDYVLKQCAVYSIVISIIGIILAIIIPGIRIWTPLFPILGWIIGNSDCISSAEYKPTVKKVWAFSPDEQEKYRIKMHKMFYKKWKHHFHPY